MARAEISNMNPMVKLSLAGVGAAMLLGCSQTPDAQPLALVQGDPLDIREVLVEHEGQKACVGYDAETNSCASLVTMAVEEDTVTAHKTVALLLAGNGGTQYIDTVTRSTLRDGQACTQAQDITVLGRDEMSAFELGEARSVIEEHGGSICSRLYRSGEGYVFASTGADGAAVAYGEQRFRFVSGDANLRAR